jgi:hypothetical protein
MISRGQIKRAHKEEIYRGERRGIKMNKSSNVNLS